MPYKDMDRKKEWEQEHRSERLARRRQLRQIEGVRIAAQPEALTAMMARPVFCFLWSLEVPSPLTTPSSQWGQAD